MIGVFFLENFSERRTYIFGCDLGVKNFPKILQKKLQEKFPKKNFPKICRKYYEINSKKFTFVCK